MTTKQFLCVFLFSLLVCGSVLAQDASEKSTKAESNRPAIAFSLPKAAPAMVSLHRKMVGNWTTTQRFEKSALMSRAGSSKGTASVTLGPGGLSVFLEFKAPRVAGAAGGGTCTAHGVIFGGDPPDENFRELWCDAATAGGCTLNKVGVGKLEGDKLVFRGEQEVEGKKMTTQTTYSFAKNSSMVITMEGATEGGEMKRLMEVTLTK